MGMPSSTQEVPVKPPVLLKQTEIATYVQDDWRVTPRLTLSMGLRHELQLSPYEDLNRLAMFDLYTGAMIVASDDGKLPSGQFLPSIVSKLTDAAGNWRFPLMTDKQAGATPRRLHRHALPELRTALRIRPADRPRRRDGAARRLRHLLYALPDPVPAADGRGQPAVRRAVQLHPGDHQRRPVADASTRPMRRPGRAPRFRPRASSASFCSRPTSSGT